TTRSSGAAVTDLQDQAGIRAAIEAAIAPRLAGMHGITGDVEVGMIDSRLRLAACDAIQVDLPPDNAAMMTAKVTCPAQSGRAYGRVRLHGWVDAVVAASNLAPNTPLTAAQLSRGRADAFAGNAGLLSGPREVEGKVLRVGLTAGAPILSPQLDLPV